MSKHTNLTDAARKTAWTLDPTVKHGDAKYGNLAGHGDAKQGEMGNGISDTFLENSFFENCGAKLTEAAYRVMLRHGVVDNWLDLKLELWKILTETVRKGKQQAAAVAPIRS